VANHSPLHIVVVSNRGPFSFSVKDGVMTTQRGSGGLVTAISSVARQHNVLWLSCALGKGDREWLQQHSNTIQTEQDMKIRLIAPTAEQYRAYYNVISNPLLWFIQLQLHDMPRSPVIDAAVWKAWAGGYRHVNQLFAKTVAESIADLEGPILVMPQDYHLYLFPRYLRELVGDRVKIQSFVHIPWPGPDTWRILPAAMRHELLDSMLHADSIGFQTERDTRRFLQTCADNLSPVQVRKPWRHILYQNREIKAAPYPISVDVDELERVAAQPETQKYLRIFRTLGGGSRRMILRVDRVEPSKNILRGLIAYRNFLTAHPQFRGKVYMLALLVPSRTEISEYKEYLRDVMALVGEINATLGESDWEPIHVMLGNNYERALAALSQYDVLMINTMSDGMNLVAKEGATLNQRDGVLILSEEAGVAEEFGNDALMVSPFDVYSTQEAIRNALTMPANERKTRADHLREQVKANDIHRWFVRQVEDMQGELKADRLRE